MVIVTNTNRTTPTRTVYIGTNCSMHDEQGPYVEEHMVEAPHIPGPWIDRTKYLVRQLPPRRSLPNYPREETREVTSSLVLPNGKRCTYRSPMRVRNS